MVCFRRNFSAELAAQKCVRLVFNGHVLQPDTKTLQACGIFDNCVIHCLVHTRKQLSQNNSQNTSSNTGNPDQHNQQMLNAGLDGPQNNGNNLAATAMNRGGQQNRFTDLFVYFGRGLTGLILAYGWYCQFRYSYLFSWFSTIGLILITAVYFGLMMINVFIEIETTTE